jgi:hypothetical protein
MKKISIFLSLVFFLLIAGSVGASPLRLEYSVTDLGGGLFDYEFDLIFDNNDTSWASGQGWGWLIFGDGEKSSPLTDFVCDADDFPVGPWDECSPTSGGHNGPTLGPVTDLWEPSFIGETLSWSGTSTANLAQGDLLYSTLWAIGGDVVAPNFETAYRVSAAPVPEPAAFANLSEGSAPVPEPATMLLLGSGLVGLAGLRRKFRK